MQVVTSEYLTPECEIQWLPKCWGGARTRVHGDLDRLYGLVCLQEQMQKASLKDLAGLRLFDRRIGGQFSSRMFAIVLR